MQWTFTKSKTRLAGSDKVFAEPGHAPDSAISKFRAAEISVYGWLRKLGQ